MQLRQPVCLLTFFSSLFIAADAHSQVFRFWKDPVNGAYNNPFAWTPSGVPNASDGAGFDEIGIYGVAFPDDETTGIVTVSAGSVTFSLNSSLSSRTLTVLGTLTLDDGNLSVFGGTVDPGALVIKNDGDLIIQGNATVDTGDIPVEVTGEFSNWTIVTGFTRIGEFANGTLLIEDGASVFNDDGVAIGRFVGSDGALTVTGANSLLDVDATLTVGQEGAGDLFISDGAEVDNSLGLCHVAFDASSSGSVTVTGASSILNSFGVNVGVSGPGTLLIEAGGCVSNGVGAIGANSGSAGAVTVRSGGSTWSNTSLLSVGGSGTGTLLIESGGGVSSLDGTIARFVGSSGVATVTGAGSSWTMADELKVGVLTNEFATALLTIADGGSVSSASGAVGGSSGFLQPAPDADVVVTGDGSILTISGALSLNKSGNIFVSSGGTVDVNDVVTVSGDLFVDGGTFLSHDGLVGPSGNAFVTGDGATWNMTGGLSIAGFDPPGLPPQGALLSIQSGAAVIVAEDIAISDHGFLAMDGGELAAPSLTKSGAGQFDFLGGAFHVEQVEGILVNQGGLLAPGQSAGSTTVNGAYVQTGGALDIEIGGLNPTTEHDVVLINGSIQIDGGDLRLSLLDEFVPNFLHTFTVLNGDSEIQGQFDNVANGQRVDTADGLGSFLVHYGSGSVFSPNHIVLTSFEPACPADVDGSGAVDVSDLLALLAAWGDCPAPCPPTCAADVNGDCEVNVSDLLALLAAWGGCP